MCNANFVLEKGKVGMVYFIHLHTKGIEMGGDTTQWLKGKQWNPHGSAKT